MNVKKGASRRRTEVVIRDGRVTACDIHVHIHADRQRGLPAMRESSTWIDVKGSFREPVSGVSFFSLLLIPSKELGVGQAEVPSIGSFTQTKPLMQGVVQVDANEYQMLALLAATNKLTYIDVAFTQPFRNRALIVRTSFDSTIPDDE